MKYPLSCLTAGLAALLQLQGLCFGGAVSIQRNQPQSVVRQLKAALDSRTDELTQQKNIAHGLELEVRELQEDLQAEKKALSTETQKEQTLQLKLNRVRAVLDDGPSVKSSNKRGDVGSSVPLTPVLAVTPMVAPLVDDVAVMKTGAHNGQPMQPLEVPPIQESLESLPSVADTELDANEDVLTAYSNSMSKPPAATPQAPAATLEESTPVVHSRQTMPQEPPPFFEAAAAIQSSSEIKAAPVKHTVKLMKAVGSDLKAPKTSKSHVAKAASGAHKVASAPKHAPKVKLQKAAPQPKAKHSHPSPLLRGSESNSKVVAAPVVAKPEPVETAPVVPVVSAPKPEANTASTVQDGDAAPAPTSDFDALEAQLHEEDRRIQDLDKENALDAMSDGGLPAAPGSSPPPASNASPTKAAAAQPKLELDSEGPMEDFLSVEAPGPDANEAPAANAASASAPDADVALPQADAADAALSDNQFLTQIAPSPRHA